MREYSPWIPGVALVKIDPPVDAQTYASDTRALQSAVLEVDRFLSELLSSNRLSGSCTISQEEIWESLPVFSVTQQDGAWLQLLKSKGAPITGGDKPRTDPRYCMAQVADFMTGNIVVSWWRC